MNKILFCVIPWVVLVGIIIGCSSPPAPVPTAHAPLLLPTLIPPTPIPTTATPTPTMTPNQSSPTPTSPPIPTITVAPTLENPSQVLPTAALPTATPLPTASPTPMPSPTSAIPRGLYVTDLRIDPPPVRGPDLKFYATFINSMEHEQNYHWAVYIFRADTQRGIGETTRTDLPIPTGTIEQVSLGSWKLPLGGPCDYFYAQVGWINADNKTVWFTTPNGSVFQKGFTVCPP